MQDIVELGAELGRFLDPLAMACVLGGALVAGLLRGGRGGLAHGLAALRPFFAADPEADALAAIVAVGRITAIAEARGVTCADRVPTAGRFLREAVRHLADARSSADFAAWAAESLRARRARHAAGAAFWRDAADAAPAMGMLATVTGLVEMFAHMDDPARIGAPMASALVATLWGLVVANLLAGPVADRLERLSAAELVWQERTLDRLAALARAELDHARGLHDVLQRRFGA